MRDFRSIGNPANLICAYLGIQLPLQAHFFPCIRSISFLRDKMEQLSQRVTAHRLLAGVSEQPLQPKYRSQQARL